MLLTAVGFLEKATITDALPREANSTLAKVGRASQSQVHPISVFAFHLMRNRNTEIEGIRDCVTPGLRLARRNAELMQIRSY
jgi:hypothetical protein